MTHIVAKRELLHAANNLVKTNRPSMQEYAALLTAVATMYKYSLGDVAVDYDCVLVRKGSK